jgi:hypothetical protein
MSGVSHAAMHHDHRAWQSENAFWRDQLREWEEQTAKAVEELASIRSALAEHTDVLRRHGAAVRLYEQNSAEHEHQIATAASTTSSEIPLSTDGKHFEEIADHHQVRLRHEALKQHHHELMARFSLLVQSMKAEP